MNPRATLEPKSRLKPALKNVRQGSRVYPAFRLKRSPGIHARAGDPSIAETIAAMAHFGFGVSHHQVLAFRPVEKSEGFAAQGQLLARGLHHGVQPPFPSERREGRAPLTLRSLRG